MTVVKDKTDEYVYFIYSETQEKMRTEVEARVNKKFIPGEVLVHGDWKQFTQIAKVSNMAMFPDSIVVAEGYKEKMKYHDCSSQWKVGL